MSDTPPPVRSRRASNQKSGTVTASVEKKDGTPLVQHSDQLPPVESAVEMASIGVGLSVTKNLGNYESARISVNVTIPVPYTREGMAQGRTRALNIANSYLEEVRDEFLNTGGADGAGGQEEEEEEEES